MPLIGSSYAYSEGQRAATQVAGAITRSQYVRHWRHSAASVRRAVRPIRASLTAPPSWTSCQGVSNTPCCSSAKRVRSEHGHPLRRCCRCRVPVHRRLGRLGRPRGRATGRRAAERAGSSSRAPQEMTVQTDAQRRLELTAHLGLRRQLPRRRPRRAVGGQRHGEADVRVRDGRFAATVTRRLAQPRRGRGPHRPVPLALHRPLRRARRRHRHGQRLGRGASARQDDLEVQDRRRRPTVRLAVRSA